MKWLQSTDTDFESRLATLLSDRSAVETSVSTPVRDIIATIREQGDTALCDYTARFDRLSLAPGGLAITADEIAREADKVDADLMEALNLAAARIEAFHRAQMPSNLAYQDEAGLTLGMRWTPLDAVGLYVPGGKAAYPSSVLMNALPARVAGVGRIAMCVPCPDGVLNPLVLAAARVCGVSEIYRVGGAQAVAALAYGTNSIRPVDRICRSGQCLCRRGQAPSVRSRRDRLDCRSVRSRDCGR
ncbi:histidinol dehydrogenase [Asaia bogorensis NBRC 16594]|nr:histidinol dehydrogenase [Asaia bogorensis NBRC 16594]